MKELLLYLLLYVPILVNAQSNTGGVSFEKDLSWEQIKAKAKAENKYIFVDCFATWCGPCKKMDNEIYPNDTVGKYANARFISVKIQLDTSKNDNESISKWYQTAKELQQQGKVDAFPTYLFFSAEGKLVHKNVGYRNVNAFTSLLEDALNPAKQYYTLLEKYNINVLDISHLPILAQMATSLKDNAIAFQVAKDYIYQYLNKLSDNHFCTPKNLSFVKSYYKLVSLSSEIFDFYFHNTSKIDSVMNSKGYAQNFVDAVIYYQEIYSLVKTADSTNKNISWNIIEEKIKKRFGTDYADRIIINAKIRWYNYKNNWEENIKYTVLKIEKYGLDTAGLGFAFTSNMFGKLFFIHCHKKSVLNKVIKWEESIIRLHPNIAGLIDVYAALQYKAGRKNEAIKWQTKAMKLDEASAEKFKTSTDKTFKENLEKMKRNEPAKNLSGV